MSYEYDGLSHKSEIADPELHCTFGNRSIIPDIATVALTQIPLNTSGELEDHFTQSPAWPIIILSPGQSTNRSIDNLLHCLQYGSKLGWLVDGGDRSVLILIPQHGMKIYRGDRQLPVLSGIDLQLTAQDVFSGLKLGKKE